MFIHCKPKELAKLESITKDYGRFYKLPSGNIAASVTTVTGHSSKKHIQEWRERVGDEEANRISRIAAGRGTRMHKLCEDYLMNDSNYAKKAMPDALSFFHMIRPYVDRINNIHFIEDALWSEELRIAGRTDCIGEFNGVLSVIDFKTSGKEKTEEQIQNYFQQTTAYSIMYEEHVGVPIDQIVIMIAVEGGNSQLYVRNPKNYVADLQQTIRNYYDSIVDIDINSINMLLER